MKKLLLLLALSLLLINSFAQTYSSIDYKAIIAEFEKSNMPPYAFDTIRILAYLNWGESVFNINPDSSMQLLKTGKDIANNWIEKNSPDHPAITSTKILLASLINDIAYLNDFKGNVYFAIELNKQSLNIRREVNDQRGIAESLNNIGFIYFNQGDLGNAIEYNTESLKIRELINDRSGIAMSLNNLGFIYFNQGNYAIALDYYSRSLKLYEEDKNELGMAYAYNNIGFAYAEQGNIEKAYKFYELSLSIKEKLNDRFGMAFTINNMAILYNSKDDVDKALIMHQKCLKIREEIGDKRGIAGSLNNLGFCYDLMGDTASAIKYYKQCLENSEKNNDKYWITASLINLSKLYFQYKKFTDFEFYAKRSYDESKTMGFPKRIIESASLMRDLYLLKGRNESTSNNSQMYLTQADQYAIEINDLINKSLLLNFVVLSEKEKEEFYKTLAPLFNEFNAYALFRKDNNPEIVAIVYNNAIRNKGILLKSSTAMRNAVINSKDTALINLYYQWLSMKKNIFNNYNDGIDTKELDEKANELEKLLVKQSQIFSDFNKIQYINWQDIQKNLKKHEAAIEFIQFKVKQNQKGIDSILYCALVIKPKLKYPLMIPLFEEKQLEKIIKKISDNDETNVSNIYNNSNKKELLYQLIWKPLEIHLKDTKTVYYSPDGLLHKIAMAAIKDDSHIYLSEKKTLYQQCSLSKIVFPEDFMIKPNFVTGIYGGIDYNTDTTTMQIWDFLPGTQFEAEEIKKMLEDNNYKTQYFSGREANEMKFKSIFSQCNIIHIATHGFFYPDPDGAKNAKEKKLLELQLATVNRSNGFGVWQYAKNKNPLMRSGLVLSEANNVWNQKIPINTEDGVLTAYEVSNMNLQNTQLVLLSACETGLGDIKGSEGVYGLQRAFKMAGVKYIIMSLWQVPDKETVDYMTTFYSKLLKQKDIRRAFTETQIEMRKKYDPYYWAAFVLIE